MLSEAAKARGASMAFLPEGFDYIAESKEDSLSLAEALDGDTISAYRSIARESSIALSLGGFHRRSDVAGKTRNTHVVIDERGEVASTYQKCHLFDVDIPEKNIRLIKSASRSSCADEASFATIALSGHQQCKAAYCRGMEKKVRIERQVLAPQDFSYATFGTIEPNLPHWY